MRSYTYTSPFFWSTVTQSNMHEASEVNVDTTATSYINILCYTCVKKIYVKTSGTGQGFQTFGQLHHHFS